MNEARILAHLRAGTDGAAMDDVDEPYDAMVRAAEGGDEAEYRRLRAIHEVALAYLVARGLIEED